MTVRAIYRKPFSLDMPASGVNFRGGITVASIGKSLGIGDEFEAENGFALIDGVQVELSAIVQDGCKVEFGHAVEGGGEDSGKQVLSIVAALGLSLATGGIAGGLLETAGGLFAAGSTSANLLAGGVGLIGSLLLNGLTPPPTFDGADDNTSRTAGVGSNALAANGIVPRVIGERRVAPVLLAQPLVTLRGRDEVVEAVYGLNGPHRLQDIKIGSAEASSMAGVETETRAGFAGAAPLKLLDRYGVTQSLNAELKGHLVESDEQATLSRDVDVTLATPQAMTLATRQSPDEHQIQIGFPQGIGRASDEGDKLRIPFRLRIRPSGGDWVNLPELHYRAAETRLIRTAVRLLWQDEGTIAPEISATSGWVEAITTVSGQNVTPATDDWEADSYFYDGSGDVEMWGNNLGTTGVQHVYADADEVRIHLDPATFAPGQYEIEIRRGCAVRESTWSRSAYTVGGLYRDLFWYHGTKPVIPQTREGLADTVAVLRSVSIWNKPPVTSDDFALIAVRARNVQVNDLTVLAGGWVKDWGGSAWDTWSITSNPAPHMRDIFAGAQNLDPLPEANIDDTNMMVPFRTFCTAQGYECNALLRGVSVYEATNMVAACGYGRAYMSEVWGVVWDRDRSADSPSQLFTPRNSAGFTIRKSFARLPDGLRVTFDNSANEWDTEQILVYRRGVSRDTGRTEQVRYEGIDTEAAAIARAEYDLAVLERRAATYSADVPPEAIVSRRGDLVAFSHDSLSARHGEGRVIAGGASGVILDTVVPLVSELELYAVSDVYDIADLWDAGQQSAAAVRRADGTVDVVALTCTTGTSDTLTFAAPTTHIDEGDLIAVGPVETEILRLVVASITPQSDLMASMSFVDEASELFA